MVSLFKKRRRKPKGESASNSIEQDSAGADTASSASLPAGRTAVTKLTLSDIEAAASRAEASSARARKDASAKPSTGSPPSRVAPAKESAAGNQTNAGAAATKPPRGKDSSADDSSGHPRRAKDFKFRTLATGRPNQELSSDASLERTRLLLREVFAPSSPVQSKKLFAGRLQELERVISSLEDKRSHVIIYGHRGWGKSSLANTVAEIAQEARYLVVSAACGAQASFSEMFRSFLSEIPLLYDREMTSAGHDPEQSSFFDHLLPEGDFTAKQLTDVMERLTSTRVIMVLDEYDRIQNEDFKLAITETIKNFSDHAIRAQLMIVGVADTQDQLVGLNPSIRRNITGVQLRLMTADEALALIEIGEEISGIKFDQKSKAKILELSHLTPYNLKLLCLHAAQNALSRRASTVSQEDALVAARRAEDDSAALLQDQQLELLGEQCSDAKRRLLFAMSVASTNPLDEFNISDVVEVLDVGEDSKINALNVGRRVAEFAKDPDPILTKRKSGRRVYYSFADAMMGFYLRLRSYEEFGEIDPSSDAA